MGRITGQQDWHITLDPWGNVLSEHNPEHLQPAKGCGWRYSTVMTTKAASPASADGE
ncbi:TPA: hypothetical protein N2F43_004685 [Salmonella enterica]|nr:hypothetical protein [Salmonella enterica]